MLKYYAFRLLLAVLPHVPRRLGLHGAAALAPPLAALSPARRAVRDNLRHVLGPNTAESELRRLTVEVFRNQLKNYFDVFHFATRSDDDIRRTVRERGLRRLLAQSEPGRGTVAVGLHFGNLDVIGLLAPLEGMAATAAVEPLEPRRLFDLMRGLRARTGLDVQPPDKAAVRMLRALRRGDFAVVLADRYVGGTSITVPFFGQPATLTDAYARLARRFEARMVVLYGLRLPDDTFELHARLLPPVEVTDDEEADIRAIVARTLAAIEQVIAEHPGQWVMFRPVWPQTVAGHA